MPKLTGTQLVILSAAAHREDRVALPLPDDLKLRGAAVNKTLEALVKKGLLEEKPASRGGAVWREGKAGKRLTLVISEAGLGLIDGENKAPAPKRKASARRSTKTDRKRAARKATSNDRPETNEPAIRTRKGTKQAQLIGLLEREDGATIDEIVEATGWQPHSVRGAISGTLKKKLGLAVSSEKVEGLGRVYRIAGHG